MSDAPEVEPYPECRHPLHTEKDARLQTKTRCMCWNCLATRDGVLGNAIIRTVDVVERGTLHQIQSQAENLEAAFWDTELYKSSGAAETIAQANGELVAESRAAVVKLRNFLDFLDARGGLGLDIHAEIRKLLAETA